VLPALLDAAILCNDAEVKHVEGSWRRPAIPWRRRSSHSP
jgi:hypothetical protein